MGDAVPATWVDDGSGRPVVAWLMKGEDYLGCQTAAGDLRKLQRRYGGRVRLSLVYVGQNPGWVAGFVHRERITAEFHYLTHSEFRRSFGGLKLPAFFVTDGGRVRARAVSPDGVGPPPGARTIVEQAVAAAFTERRQFRGAEASPDDLTRRNP